MPSFEHLTRGDDAEHPAPPAVAPARSVASRATGRAHASGPAWSPDPPSAAGDPSGPIAVDDLWDRLGDFA